VTVPTAYNHLVQARENRSHAEWLLASRPQDPTTLQWAVTAAFYSALHGLTAHLMARGVIVRNHQARFKALADPNSGVPLNIYDGYRALHERSLRSRYDLRTFTFQQVRDLLDQELATIATFTGM
jgi:uncharacterized protein (UPF0332 family)